MTWTHCTNAEIADTLDCPTCGLSKAAWTVTLNATRTFVVAKRSTGRAKTSWLEVELPGLPGAAVEVELPDGRVVAARLDGAGRHREEGLYPGDCRVRFPERAATWTSAASDEERAVHAPDDEGWITCATDRRHVFAAAAPGVRLTWPPAGEHRQWVNLGADAARPERGSRLKVQVATDGPAFARVLPGPDNSRRDRPRPGVVAPPPGEDGVIDLGAPRGEVTLEVELGLAGGDVFEVQVGATRACADASVRVTTWRRLDYQLTRSAAQPPFDLAPAREAFARVFVDLQQVHEVVLAPDRPGTPPGAWLPDTALPADDPPRPAGPRLVYGNHNHRWFDGLFAGPPGPAPCAHVVVVDGVYDGNQPGGAPHRQTLEFTLTSPEDPGRSIERSAETRLLPVAVQDGRHCLIEGVWASEAPPGHPDHGRTGVVRPDDLTIKWRLRVAVKLAGVVAGDGAPPPGAAPTDAATRHPVRVRLDLHVALGPKEGRSMGALAAVVFTPTPGWISPTVVHELGHALRQAGTVAPPGLDLADHGRFYKGKTHNGPHCAHGLTDEQFAERSFSAFQGACVMWGSKDETRPPTLHFCPRCAPFVRADHFTGFGVLAEDP
ncbi:MAG: hypothetical protein M9894_04615 [Planctomycetes bacterium]|nr:hypothetical protein [Planctomycetota bacterium]